MKYIKFRRDVAQMRPFETRALDTDIPLVGGYFFNLNDARIEAQALREGAEAVTEGTVDLFFKLINPDGAEEIEIVRQVIPGVMANAGFVPPSSDGTVNLTILDEFVNGYAVLSTVIEGEKLRLILDQFAGIYLPEDAAVRSNFKALRDRYKVAA